MNLNLSKSLQTLADTVIYAESTLSEYYNIGCIKVRVSDHMTNEMKCDLMIFSNVLQKHSVYTVIPMVGTYKQVQWFSNVNDVINFICDFEKMARLMLKSPEKADNIQERQKSNMNVKIESLTNNTSERVNYAMWRHRLQSFYTNKNGEMMDDLLEKCFTLSKGSAEILNYICKLSPFPKDKKITKLLDLIKTL